MADVALTLSEVRRLGACALAGARGERVSAPMPDPGRLARFCRRHRITGLVHAAAPDAGLREAALAIGVRTLNRLDATEHVLRLLAEGGVDAVPVKGCVLATRVYPDASLRPFDDLDLIVKTPAAVAAARELLVTAGWQLAGGYPLRVVGLMERFGVETKLHPPSGSLSVEVTWHPDECWLGRLPAATLAGWDPTAHLAFVALHGLRHQWSRLVWLLDVALLVEAIDPQCVHELVRMAGHWRCRRAMGLAFALAGDLLGDPACEELSDLFLPPPAGALDACRGQLCGPEKTLAARPVLSWDAKMQDSHVRAALVALRLLGTPSHGDFSALPLPPALAPLYYVLRPFRLLSSRRGGTGTGAC